MKTAKDMKAGAAQVDITPAVGVPLAGNLRARRSEGVDSSLYTRALVLSDGREYAVIVSLDLIAVNREYVDEACSLIYEQTGIPRERILVCASHTHSGPYSTEALDPEVKTDQSYMMKVCSQIASAVKDAYKRLELAEIGFASTTVRGIMHNRRLLDQNDSVWNSWLVPPKKRKEHRPAGPIDEELLVLIVKSLDDNLRAIVFNYPLHACITGVGNNISADYPGVVAKLISERLGHDVITLFTPGACGDLNHKYELELNEVGEVIASGILSVVDHTKCIRKYSSASLLKEIVLPLRDFSRFQEEEISRKWPGGLDVFRKEYENLSKLKEKEVKTVIQALVVNDAAFIGVPGELFCELGLDIKARSPYKHNFVTELANDYVGYIPTIGAFKQGGYETFNARSSKVSAGSGERIVEESLRMLKTLSR